MSYNLSFIFYFLIPQLIDSDGRAFYKDFESGPNSKITKITNMTFLQNTAEWCLNLEDFVIGHHIFVPLLPEGWWNSWKLLISATS